MNLVKDTLCAEGCTIWYGADIYSDPGGCYDWVLYTNFGLVDSGVVELECCGNCSK
jgi:hypothetical protein